MEFDRFSRISPKFYVKLVKYHHDEAVFYGFPIGDNVI